MEIKNAIYVNIPDGTRSGIRAEINGKICWVDERPENPVFQEITKQVDAGELTIEPADE